MKLEPTQIRNWFLLILAAAAVLGPAYKWNIVKAQEAGRKAATEQMAPAVEELGEIKDLMRRQEDRESFKMCMDYGHQDLAVEARNQECTKESNARWAYWECKDRTPKDALLANCGVKP